MFHERLVNIRNKLWGSYFKAKSINEFKRHLDSFMEKGGFEGYCEKTGWLD